MKVAERVTALTRSPGWTRRSGLSVTLGGRLYQHAMSACCHPAVLNTCETFLPLPLKNYEHAQCQLGAIAGSPSLQSTAHNCRGSSYQAAVVRMHTHKVTLAVTAYRALLLLVNADMTF